MCSSHDHVLRHFDANCSWHLNPFSPPAQLSINAGGAILTGMETEHHMLERLIRTHQAAIFRYLRYLGAQPALAEDLVQETFLATLKPNVHQPVGPDDPAWNGWLRGIARNLFLAECRRRGSHAVSVDAAVLEQAELVWSAAVSEESDWAQRLAALKECLKKLSTRQRAVIEHRYVHHSGRDQMAQLFGMTEDGIKTLLRRMRAALAQCIEERLGVRPTP